LKNKGNKSYQNTHGDVFKTKTNAKKQRKKVVLMKKAQKALRVTPKLLVSNKK
jgi:hypothetical protein